MERKAVAVCAMVGFLGLLSAALAFSAEATRVKASDVQAPEPGQCVYPKSPALYLGLTSAVALMMAQAIINTVAGCICCKKHPHPSDKNWTVALVSFILSLRQLLAEKEGFVSSGMMFILSFNGSLAGLMFVGTMVSYNYNVLMYHNSMVIIFSRLVIHLFKHGVIRNTRRVTFIISFLLLLTGAALNDQRGQESMYFGGYCYVVKPGVFSGGAVLSLASVALGIVYYVALSSSKVVQPLGPHQQGSQGIAMGQPVVVPPQSSQPVFVHEDTYNRRQFP